MAEDWKDDLQQNATDDPKKEPEIGSSEFANSLEKLFDPSFHRRLRVFLCHSSGDKLSVRDLHWRLKEANVDPWLDEENLLPGQTWEEEIRRAVRNSDIVVVCLSRAAIGKTGYVQKEIKFALDVADEQPEGAIFLIPLKLEECDIPERLRHLQWVSYFQENGFEKLLAALKHKAETLSVQVAPIRKVVEPLMATSPVTFSVKSVKPTKRKQAHLVSAIKTEEFVLKSTFKGHSGDVVSVAFSPDGQTLASGSRDRTIKLWNPHTGHLLHNLTQDCGAGWKGWAESIAISPDGQTIASGSDDEIKVWNLHTEELLHNLTFGYWHSRVNSVAFSPDGLTLVGGIANHPIIKVLNLHTGELQDLAGEGRRFRGHDQGYSVESVAISPDGQIIVSGNSDGTIKVLNLHTGELLHNLTELGRVFSVAISPDGQTIASADEDKIRIWGKK